MALFLWNTENDKGASHASFTLASDGPWWMSEAEFFINTMYMQPVCNHVLECNITLDDSADFVWLKTDIFKAAVSVITSPKYHEIPEDMTKSQCVTTDCSTSILVPLR